MMVIPQIIDDSVPIGRDSSENVEVKDMEILSFLTMRFLIMQIYYIIWVD